MLCQVGCLPLAKVKLTLQPFGEGLFLLGRGGVFGHRVSFWVLFWVDSVKTECGRALGGSLISFDGLIKLLKH
jgi:hypothetical protein